MYQTVAMVLRRYTQNDVIFPTPSPPSVSPSRRPFIVIFLSLLSPPNAISLDWIAPWPRAQVAMWRCILSPPPVPLPSYWFHRSGSGLIDVQQPYITVQPSLSSWWLQSYRTARSIRVTPAVHTDHRLRKWKHTWNHRPAPASRGALKIVPVIIHRSFQTAPRLRYEQVWSITCCSHFSQQFVQQNKPLFFTCFDLPRQ